jgi:hypothetical protein
VRAHKAEIRNLWFVGWKASEHASTYMGDIWGDWGELSTPGSSAGRTRLLELRKATTGLGRRTLDLSRGATLRTALK